MMICCSVVISTWELPPPVRRIPCWKAMLAIPSPETLGRAVCAVNTPGRDASTNIQLVMF